MAWLERKQYSEEQLSRNYQRAYRLVRPLFRLFFPNRVIGKEHIPERSVMVCPNHFSNLDPPCVCLALPREKPLRVMAKQELIDAPFLGWLLNRWGIFGVRRGKSDVGAIKTALRHLKAGQCMMVFPEGTRVKDGEENDAKTGAIMLAYRTGTPILPCFCERRRRPFQRTAIVFGEPYTLEFSGKKATPRDYQDAADDLLRRIYALEEWIQ